MNNTKANSLQTGQFLKIAYSGRSSRNEIRKTALYSLEGSLEWDYSKETDKKEHKFLTQNHE